ncbi:hypothetical protein [Algoriphagus limi]|uniref:Outer membrane protein beta-barrel domain-containing protein n=1 Tax=Algoriphagus limi TaxID=2975273 RepID=A0ABT2G4B1_9BACT|nr:hypothetical protein [Algoriphagus limi]MCS5490034.1 hypothetical protein [Algoriphagus limi]
MSSIIKFSALILFLTLPLMANAQNFYRERISRDNILSIGIGPSFAYLDNGGQYRDFNFEIKPAISASITKKMTPALDLRATLGVQFISSGGDPSTQIRDMWHANFASFTAKGPAFYFDVIPSINLIPFSNHMHRSRFNIYGGVGLGIMHVMTEQTKSYSPEETPTKHQVTTGYVPVRAGLSYSIGPYSDIAGEGTMLWTFSDNLDGNVGFNRFGDHLFQAQIVFRRYFKPKNLE